MKNDTAELILADYDSKNITVSGAMDRVDALIQSRIKDWNKNGANSNKQLESRIKQSKVIDGIYAKYIADSVRVGGLHAWFNAKQSLATELVRMMTEALGEDYVFERAKEDYLPSVYQFLKGKNELRQETRTRLTAIIERELK